MNRVAQYLANPVLPSVGPCHVIGATLVVRARGYAATPDGRASGAIDVELVREVADDLSEASTMLTIVRGADESIEIPLWSADAVPSIISALTALMADPHGARLLAAVNATVSFA